jgi:glycosyltransferase involved in cell wall biosynthesis
MLKQPGLPRIAHVIYSQAQGGSEMAAANICSRIDRQRFDPVVLFLYDTEGPMPAFLTERGIEWHRLSHTRLSRLTGPFRLIMRLRRLGVDLLHVHHVPAFSALEGVWRRAGVRKLIVTEHAKFSISRSPRLQEACRRAAGSAHGFTVVSHDLKQYFVGQLGIPAGCLKVIHNGVDTRRFVPRSDNGSLRGLVPSCWDGPVALVVGRLTEAKDHSTLFKAVSSLKEQGKSPFFVVVGDGERRSVLESEIREMGIGDRVRLAGARTDVEGLLPDADLFVLPSQREGFPVAILEAMAAGLPVISTRVGGIPEVVESGVNGVLVPPRDPASLASAIEVLLGNPDRLKETARRARKTIEERFSIEAVTAQYERLYNDVLEQSET